MGGTEAAIWRQDHIRRVAQPKATEQVCQNPVFSARLGCPCQEIANETQAECL